MTRFRFGAPGRAKLRLRCSRLRPIAFASSFVVTGRPECATTTSHALFWSGVVSARVWGGSMRACWKRDENAWGWTRSRAPLSSMPSTITSMKPSPAQRATAGVSVGRRGSIAKKGVLGNSAAKAAAFQISSSGAPRSISAASTSTRRNTASSSSAERVVMIFHFRRGKPARTRARARSRSRRTTSVGIVDPFREVTSDARFDGVEVRLALYELTNDGIMGVHDLVDGSDLTHLALVEHGDPRSDGRCAPHVVRDDDAGDAELLAHSDHQLVDDRAGDGVETRRRLVVKDVLGLPRDRSGDTDPLPHSTRQLRRKFGLHAG